MRLLIAALLIVLAATALLVYGAPAPKRAPAPRKEVPAPTPAVVGVWNMVWGDGEGRTVFEPYGAYSTVWDGQLWLGRWEAKGGKLRVWEWLVDWPAKGKEEPPSWTVEIDASGIRGKVNGCDDFPFELKPLPPDA